MLRGDDVTVLQELAERLSIDARLPMTERAQRLQFRTEPQRVAVPTVVQGFDADTIADEVQDALAFIPQREREHADESLDGLDAPLLESGQDDFGVARAFERVPQRHQRRADVGVVVDLAVENHDEAPVLRRHGLVAALGEIDDRQPSMSQSRAGSTDPNPAVVRSSMTQTRRGRAEITRETLGIAATSYESSNSAHWLSDRPDAADTRRIRLQQLLEKLDVARPQHVGREPFAHQAGCPRAHRARPLAVRRQVPNGVDHLVDVGTKPPPPLPCQ